MSTISPARTDPQDRPPRGRRWPLLVGLLVVLLAGLTAAALHNVSEREDRIGFTATGVQKLAVAIRAGRVELVPSPDGRIQVTTTRQWSVWAPAARHRQVGDILALSDDCPPLGSLGITRCAVDHRITVPTRTRVRVTASTGELAASDLAAASLEAHVTRGSITASFTRPPDRVLVRLDAGSLRLVVPAASYAVDATVPAHAGHLNVQVPTDPAAPRQLSAHTSAATSRSFAGQEGVHKVLLILGRSDSQSKPSPHRSPIVGAGNHLLGWLPSGVPVAPDPAEPARDLRCRDGARSEVLGGTPCQPPPASGRRRIAVHAGTGRWWSWCCWPPPRAPAPATP